MKITFLGVFTELFWYWKGWTFGTIALSGNKFWLLVRIVGIVAGITLGGSVGNNLGMFLVLTVASIVIMFVMAFLMDLSNDNSVALSIPVVIVGVASYVSLIASTVITIASLVWNFAILFKG